MTDTAGYCVVMHHRWRHPMEYRYVFMTVAKETPKRWYFGLKGYQTFVEKSSDQIIGVFPSKAEAEAAIKRVEDEYDGQIAAAEAQVGRAQDILTDLRIARQRAIEEIGK